MYMFPKNRNKNMVYMFWSRRLIKEYACETKNSNARYESREWCLFRLVNRIGDMSLNTTLKQSLLLLFKRFEMA